ncbi:Alpha/Beta hydrolase protein [Melanogaster broomeanus]|nr:Alpha/Beta hydrolase protein [Melanogaster broomeanus]
MAHLSRDVTPLRTGVALEVTTSHPAPECNSTRAAFCLHPWSWLGGSMYDPTVQTIVRSLKDNDFYVVYYNSRGVGKSTGWPSFTGKVEGSDLKELVHEFLEEHPQINSVTFIGYSHGSLIVTLHPVLPQHIKTSYVLLSYPLSPRGLLTMFNTKMYSSALTWLLRDAGVSLLVIYGDQDDFTSHSKYKAWTELLKKTEGAKAQLEIASVAKAGHFWHTESSRATLKRTLESWLMKVTAD